MKTKRDYADTEFKKMGGEAYQEKSQYEQIILATKNTLSQREKKAEDFAAGVLPFALLKSEIQNLIQQAEYEEEAKRYVQFESSAQQLEQLVLNEIADSLSSSQNSLFRKAFQKALQTVFSARSKEQPFLNLSSSVTLDLLKGLPDNIAREQDLLNDFLKLASDDLLKIETYQRKLENIPADDVIAPLLEKNKKIHDQIEQQETQVATLRIYP